MKWIISMMVGVALIGCYLGISAAQTLIVGSSEWRPWQIREGEKLIGITPDILQEISKRTGFSIIVKRLPHKRMMHEFQTQQIDLEPTVNPAWRENQKDISVYTIPFYTTRDIILARKEKDVKGTSVHDFKGLLLGCGLGYYYPQGFQEAFENGEIRREDNPVAENNLHKLSMNRIDGAIFDEIQSGYIIKVFKMNPADFKTVFEFKPSGLSLRLHKSKQDLLPVLNDTIVNMKADKTIEQIVKKYIE